MKKSVWLVGALALVSIGAVAMPNNHMDSNQGSMRHERSMHPQERQGMHQQGDHRGSQYHKGERRNMKSRNNMKNAEHRMSDRGQHMTNSGQQRHKGERQQQM